jgi:hypothetical protein
MHTCHALLSLLPFCLSAFGGIFRKSNRRDKMKPAKTFRELFGLDKLSTPHLQTLRATYKAQLPDGVQTLADRAPGDALAAVEQVLAERGAA